MLVDVSSDQVRSYRSEQTPPPDFDRFWADSIERAVSVWTEPVLIPVETGLTVIDTFDLTFRGYGGDPVRAWLHRPARSRGPLPVVVEFHGYGGGRGLPFQNTIYAAAGHAHLVVDVRGQGLWAVNDTPDAEASDDPGSVPGYMTRQIGSPERYYFTRVFTDAVMAVRSLRHVPFIDPGRIAVAGASQGGAIALAVGALVPEVVAAMIDVPFLCDVPKAIELSDRDPYAEITRYLARYRDRRASILRTLSYVDGVSFAARSHAPALFSVALRDLTCPPPTVYAAYNAYAGQKSITEYPDNDHEGGAEYHQAVKLNWITTLFGGIASELDGSHVTLK